MNKALLIFIIFLALINPAWAGTETDGDRDLIAGIKARADQVDTFTCDFRQERHLKVFSKPVVFKGRLLVDRPDKLRWEFTSPVPSVLILNSNQGLRCSPEGRKREFSLDSDPVMAQVAEQLWNWLSGNYNQLESSYHISSQTSPPVLTITPENQETSAIIEEVRIQFKPRILHPTSITILEPGGDRTRLFFSNYELNQDLKDSLFLECGDISEDNDGS